MTRCLPSRTKTWPSCRSSCCSSSGRSYAASSSASSRTRPEASRNRGSASISSISRSYFSGRVASRMSGTPSSSSASTSSARSSWMPAYSSRTSSQRARLRSRGTTDRSCSPASAISIQPLTGSNASIGGTASGRRRLITSTSAASCRSWSVFALNHTVPASVGHAQHRGPGVDVRLLDVTGTGQAESRRAAPRSTHVHRQATPGPARARAFMGETVPTSRPLSSSLIGHESPKCAKFAPVLPIGETEGSPSRPHPVTWCELGCTSRALSGSYGGKGRRWSG